MSQQELLAKVVQTLNEAEIDYMVTGSVVSSLQGEPRSTHDIDFVVSVEQETANKLANAFPPPAFYLDPAITGNLQLVSVRNSECVAFKGQGIS